MGNNGADMTREHERWKSKWDKNNWWRDYGNEWF
jgi:hypothetical protein